MKNPISGKKCRAAAKADPSFSKSFYPSSNPIKKYFITDLCLFGRHWPDSDEYMLEPLLKLVQKKVKQSDAVNRLPIFRLFIHYLNTPEVSNEDKKKILSQLHLKIYEFEGSRKVDYPIFSPNIPLPTHEGYLLDGIYVSYSIPKNFAQLLNEMHPIPEDFSGGIKNESFSEEEFIEIVRRYWYVKLNLSE